MVSTIKEVAIWTKLPLCQFYSFSFLSSFVFKSNQLNDDNFMVHLQITLRKTSDPSTGTLGYRDYVFAFHNSHFPASKIPNLGSIQLKHTVFLVSILASVSTCAYNAKILQGSLRLVDHLTQFYSKSQSMQFCWIFGLRLRPLSTVTDSLSQVG